MAKIPDKIDKYEIQDLIASGGMGEVYIGVHPTLDRKVILKKLTLRGNASMTERFRREAKLLMDFRNDHIVDVYDHFVQGRTHFIVMEYVDGASVKDLLESERYFDNASAAYIALYTAKALAYAHRKTVIHRDVKPGNVLISRSGEVKLADFGIATSVEGDPDDGDLTAEGMTLGTPAYMAPEQFKNSRNVDYRADLYSLGVMLYEMLVGRRPYAGGFSPEVIQLIQRGKYKKPRRVNPSVAPELQRVIVSLIKSRPKSRCGDLGLVIRRLERYLARFQAGDPQARVSAMVRSEEKPPLRRRKKNPLAGALISAAAAALLLGAPAFLCARAGMHRLVLNPSETGLLFFGSRLSSAPPVTSLYVDDGRTIPEYPAKVRYVRWKEGYSSLPLILPPGNYRSKTLLDGRLHWNSFYVPPWSDGNRGASVHLGTDRPENAAVPVKASVRDALTGRILDGEAEVRVAVPSGYETLAEHGPVKVGGIHRFRVSAPLYYPQDFTLKVSEGYDELDLDAALLPLGARIEFSGVSSGMGMTVNGQKRFPRIVNALTVMGEADFGKEKTFLVPPGQYLIGVTDDGWNGEAEFRAGPGMQYRLTLIRGENRIKVEALR